MRLLLCAIASSIAVMPAVRVSADGQSTAQPRPTPSAPRARATEPRSRVFIDLNAGYQSGELTFTDGRSDPLFGETASWSADYAVKSGPALDVGGGARLWRRLFAAVAYSRVSDTNVAAVVGSVPHPFFFNRDREYAGESVGLAHKEQVFHVGVSWIEPVGPHFEVRAFGGPSFFRLERDLISNVTYSESYPFDTATFSNAVVTPLKENTVGFHVGGDVTWLFSRTVGVGALVRFTRAEALLTSPASGDTFTLDQGGLQVGVGLRLRLGGRAASPPAVRPRPSEPVQPRPPASEPDAQQPGSLRARDSAVANSDVEVFVRPSATEPLRTLPAGTRVTVRDEVGDWLMIEFPDTQWGTRVGYVRKDKFDR